LTQHPVPRDNMVALRTHPGLREGLNPPRLSLVRKLLVKKLLSPVMQTTGQQRKELVMTRSLPSTPNLRYLKEESKDILKAHKNADPSCCAVLRNLRQLRRKSDAEILQTKIGLQEVQLALSLEYAIRNWTDLKRFVEYVQNTNAKTEQELNLATMKTWFEGLAKGEWRDYLIRPDELIHYNEEVRTWNEIDRLSAERLDMKRKNVVDEVEAAGDKVKAHVVTRGPLGNNPDKEMTYRATWRFEGGRIAEAWIPQSGPNTKDENGLPGTRLAMTWLDRHMARSPYLSEINYVNILLHDLARSAPMSLTIAENVPLPEVRNPENGEIIKTILEHVFLRLRTMTRETASIYLREQGNDFIASISFGDEPEETCRIDVERYNPE
jgi:hypothetical protein